MIQYNQNTIHPTTDISQFLAMRTKQNKIVHIQNYSSVPKENYLMCSLCEILWTLLLSLYLQW